MNALAFVAADTKQGKVAHRLEKDRDGTEVFAKSAIVLEQNSEKDTHHIIAQIADEKEHEHGVCSGFPEPE